MGGEFITQTQKEQVRRESPLYPRPEGVHPHLLNRHIALQESPVWTDPQSPHAVSGLVLNGTTIVDGQTQFDQEFVGAYNSINRLLGPVQITEEAAEKDGIYRGDLVNVTVYPRNVQSLEKNAHLPERVVKGRRVVIINKASLAGTQKSYDSMRSHTPATTGTELWNLMSRRSMIYDPARGEFVRRTYKNGEGTAFVEMNEHASASVLGLSKTERMALLLDEASNERITLKEIRELQRATVKDSVTGNNTLIIDRNSHEYKLLEVLETYIEAAGDGDIGSITVESDQFAPQTLKQLTELLIELRQSGNHEVEFDQPHVWDFYMALSSARNKYDLAKGNVPGRSKKQSSYSETDYSHRLWELSPWTIPGDEDLFAEGVVGEKQIRPTNISVRSLEADRELMRNMELNLGTSGSEYEFAIAVYLEDDDGSTSMHLVDIQDALDFINKYSTLNVTIEGWASQGEHPTSPRGQNQTYEGYRGQVATDLYRLFEMFNLFGMDLIHTSVIPGDNNELGQPNFANPHVANVLSRGLANALGREQLSLDEAADILSGFRTNGHHITIALQRDPKFGLVGDERLNMVYNETHGKIMPLLRAFTHSGNMRTHNQIFESLSEREELRNNLPTATLGQVIKFSDAAPAMAGGGTPSLERATLTNKEGILAGAAHNLLGRQKAGGFIEFCFADAIENIDVALSMESLFNLFVTSVDKALLKHGHNWKSVLGRRLGWSEDKIDFFLGNMEDADEYRSLAHVVDTEGFFGEIQYQSGDSATVAEAITDFIDFVQDMAAELDVKVPVNHNEYTNDYDRLAWLKERTETFADPEFDSQSIIDAYVPDSFIDYLDPSHPLYGYGSIALVAQKRFGNILWEMVAAMKPGQRLLDDDINILEEQDYINAHNLLLQELKDAQYEHVKAFTQVR